MQLRTFLSRNYIDKTIECNDVLFFGHKEGYNDDAKVFIELCEGIYEIIVSSDGWKSLPEYEALYK